MRARTIIVTLFMIAVAAPWSAGAGPVEDLIGCDPIDPSLCLLPFPNDHYTVDADTATGKRVNISPLATPRALQGAKPIFTDEINRNDGFSPGSMVLSFVPGLDLHQTWGTTGVTPVEHRDHIADIGRYAADDAPILIINADTGERHPFWSELDTHPQTGADERLLILRPAVNFEEGGRYLVALRDLRDANGDVIAAGAFADYLAGTGSNAERQTDVTHIVAEIEAAEAGRGFDRDELYLAWDFTVASADNLAGRVLHMRDDAFASLGDADLSDVTVEGDAPAFTVDEVIPGSGDTKAMIHGRFTVPNYLIQHVQTPELYDESREYTDERVSPIYSPHSRLFYPPGSDVPAVNPAQPTLEAYFTCRIPSSATALNRARPILMGHGLLGQRYEVGWSSAHLLTREHSASYCGTEWIGMAFGDLPQVATILLDPSLMPSLADRAQQGLLNFMFLGRLMIHPDGFASHPAWQDGNSESLIDISELVYDGNSQGGIMGGALAALAPDFTEAVLGVPAMNYSTLLNRSVDWEGEYGDIMYASVPDKREQQLVMALIQMLWDRGEANGYAHHMTDDPYPNTPAHRVILHVAYADYQVANVAAEVEARTIGARLLQTSLAPSRHWSADPTFGFELFDTDGGGAILPHAGSALVYWDSGNPIPPNGNVPPAGVGQDPHGDPRSFGPSGNQRIHFFDTGEVIDVLPGSSYCTHRFPRHPDLFPSGCPTS